MTLPLENLDDKTFDDLVKEAISRIPVYAPGWTDRNPTDPGITFIELFAWLAEMQIYRLNRIDERSYKKFFKLLGMPGISPPRAAEANVTFSLIKGGLASVPEGTKVAALDPFTGEEIIFETMDEVGSNTVSAVQRVLVEEVGFSSTGLPDQTFVLDKKPVVAGSLKLKCEGWDWTEVEDLDGSGPGDDHYVLDPASGTLTFGDGIRGRIPSKSPKEGTNISVSYHWCCGVRGNVNAHSICRVVDDDLRDLVRVDNKERAWGGEDGGSLEEAMARAKRELKEVTRAVTSSDYEHLALKAPGVEVARARAIPRYHPIHEREIPHVVSVIVVPDSPEPHPIPGPDFLNKVYRFLDERRLLTTEIFVLPPVYVPVSVTATVVKRPQHLAAGVEEKVRERLDGFLHPTRGGPEGDGWPFGRPVYVSEIFEAIDGVDGVDYVERVKLFKEGSEQKGDLIIPKHGLVYSAPHDITVEEDGSGV